MNQFFIWFKLFATKRKSLERSLNLCVNSIIVVAQSENKPIAEKMEPMAASWLTFQAVFFSIQRPRCDLHRADNVDDAAQPFNETLVSGADFCPGP